MSPLFANLKIIDLGIFQSLKFRILMEKVLQNSLQLNFTPNTLGCCGLMIEFTHVPVWVIVERCTNNNR